MAASVYLETTIPSYLAAQPSRDLITAARRLEYLAGLPSLPISPAAERLAESLLRTGLLPAKAAADALHIAIAASNDVDFLLTWNIRHLANAALRHQIDKACRDAGLSPPVLCTPEELMEG